MTVFALSPPPESSSGSAIPVIIAVSVTLFCCCVVVVVVVVAAVFCWKRRKPDFSTNKAPVPIEAPVPDNDSSGKGPGTPLLKYEYEENENDVLIMNDGIRVDPIPIENVVKEELWFISNCMLVGHNRAFLSILLTFKTGKGLDTILPADKLLPIIPEMLKLVEIAGGRNTNEEVAEIAEKKCKPLIKAIKEGIDRVNSKDVCHDHQIKKWAIMSNDFSIQGGELDATMKLNRSRVAEKYRQTIDLIYESSGGNSLILEAPNESNVDDAQ